MVKITKTNKQFRINVPQEIIDLTGWNETTELLFVPFVKEPLANIDENTPILLLKSKGKKK